jgi:hypothetical protein
MSALRAHQIHYGNERTARIVDTYVVDCHILTVAKPEVRELRTEGLVLIDCRRAVEGRPDESDARDDFAPYTGDFPPTPL